MNKKTKVFHIDNVKPPLDFNFDDNTWIGCPYNVYLSEEEVNKINEFNFNPNTTNSRTYNKGFLVAFLGKQIEDRNRLFRKDE